MTIGWPRQEVLEAVRTRLQRPGAVRDGYSAVDVRTEPDGMLVIFHWRRDPNTYAMRVEFPTASESPRLRGANFSPTAHSYPLRPHGGAANGRGRRGFQMLADTLEQAPDDVLEAGEARSAPAPTTWRLSSSTRV
ncbi:hypothetical protein GCM10023334_087900 [Nonomuraea thailandensis]